jgi:hypothetical protein
MEKLLKDVLRYPRLDTVLMVEKYIKKYDGEFRKRKLWEALPKKMMYQTFCVIINYLLYSGKISIDAEGKIGWIYYPERTREWLKRTDLDWNKNENALKSKICKRKNKKSVLRVGRGKF